MTRSSSRGFPFDAVLFDLDGTLVATDRFWPDAARAGALRAFEELGLQRAMPTRGDWMGMVGLPLDEAFASVFSDLDADARAVVLERCVEEEHAALRAGQAVLLPGAQAALEELRARGVRLGIASNCGRSYLEAMLTGLGLKRWIEEPRCLDSPGVTTKADMIQDLLWTFDTRSAVMVGDRISDRDAAWANGLPHVHLARGFAEPGEVAQCEAVIDGLDQLIPRLEGRAAWIDGLIERLGLMEAEALGLTGPWASGKTLLARDLARALEVRGRSVRVVEMDQIPPASLAGELAEARKSGPLVLFEGHRMGALLPAPARLPVLVMEVDEAVARRRLAGRDGRFGGPDVFQRVVEGPLAEDRDVGWDRPRGGEELRIDGNNPLGPSR